MIKNTSNDLEKLANKDLKPSPSAWVKNELRRAKKLSDISDLINFANERQTYQTKTQSTLAQFPARTCLSLIFQRI